MPTTPVLETRERQPYIYIPANLQMTEIPTVLPPLIPELLQWMETNGIAEGGPAFFRYLDMKQDGQMHVHVGVPVANDIDVTERVQAGFFPAGKYAVHTHRGDYVFLKEAHMFLEKWIKEQGLTEKKPEDESAPCWAGRAEFYITDPDTTPDPSDWITEVVFLLED